MTSTSPSATEMVLSEDVMCGDVRAAGPAGAGRKAPAFGPLAGRARGRAAQMKRVVGCQIVSTREDTP